MYSNMKKKSLLFRGDPCIGLAFIAAVTNVMPQVKSPEQQATDVLRLTVSSNSLTYAVGSTIDLSVELKNIGRQKIFIGANFWTGGSASHVTIAVNPLDGHDLGKGWSGSVDGVPLHAWDNLGKALLEWGFLLPGGYAYSTKALLPYGPGLAPGRYTVQASYISEGVDADTHLNPLLEKPKELAALMPFSWKGVVKSNTITIEIKNRKKNPQ